VIYTDQILAGTSSQTSTNQIVFPDLDLS